MVTYQFRRVASQACPACTQSCGDVPHGESRQHAHGLLPPLRPFFAPYQPPEDSLEACRSFCYWDHHHPCILGICLQTDWDWQHRPHQRHLRVQLVRQERPEDPMAKQQQEELPGPAEEQKRQEPAPLVQRLGEHPSYQMVVGSH